MRITLSPQDYAAAFRILSANDRHHMNLAELLEDRVAPNLPAMPSLLDVGAGSGKVARELAPRFPSMTLIEPNRDQLGSFELEGVEVIHRPFEDFTSEATYDLVLCSHVLHHVPLEAWESFIDRLLSFVRPEGTCVITMTANRGQLYEMTRKFTSPAIVGRLVMELLSRKGIAFEVAGKINPIITDSFEEMHALCRFFVLENCHTAERLSALSEAEAREIVEEIQRRAEGCRTASGTYQLDEEEDMILIRPAPRLKAQGRPAGAHLSASGRIPSSPTAPSAS